MSVYQNFPDEGPVLDLNFTSSTSLDPRITFARSSTGTYIDNNGTVKTAQANCPRFNHSPTTGENLGLLIEEQRTNLLTYSEQFDNAAWVKQNSHPITANSVVAPDETTTADTFYRTATNQYIYQTVVGAGTYTLSAWVKSQNATGSFVMQPYNGTDGSPGLTTFTATNVWQRFSITSTITTNSNWYPCIPVNLNENFYVWGAQLEQAVFPTSYIPTTSATVTRSSENVYISGTNFTNWYNQSVGTILCTARYAANNTTNQTAWSLYNSPSGAVRQMMNPSNGTNNAYMQAEYPVGTYPVSIGNGSSIDRTTNVKVACAFKTDDYAISQNGTAVSLDTSGTMSTHSTLYLGATVTSTWMLNGSILQLSYYPRRLSDAQLKILST